MDGEYPFVGEHSRGVTEYVEIQIHTMEEAEGLSIADALQHIGHERLLLCGLLLLGIGKVFLIARLMSLI